MKSVILLTILLSGQILAQTAVPVEVKTDASSTTPVPETPEWLELKIFGTAFSKARKLNVPPSISVEQVTTELAKSYLKIKSVPGTLSDFKPFAPTEAVLNQYDGFIVRPYDFYLLNEKFAFVLELYSSEKCYQENQVVTKKSSGIKTLDQLAGKNVVFQDSWSVINFIVNSKTKFKQHLVANSPRSTLEALNSGKADAIIETTNKFSDFTASLSIGIYKNGKAQAGDNYQVIHTSNDRIPCYGLAVKLGKYSSIRERFSDYAQKNPELSKSVFNAVGGFYSVSPISIEEWGNIKKTIINDGVYQKYKEGKLPIVFNPYK